jgi:hypothetical protein
MVKPNIAGMSENSEYWLTRNLSTEGLWFTATAAVKGLRGGSPSVPQKALELVTTISASVGLVKECCEKIFTFGGTKY